ncbi:MAG: hypothetical protein PWP24_484 [Clostridiales bacterium]|nr:hypothetical protein [Clostridiales bacterium]
MKTTDALSLLSRIRQKANNRILSELANHGIEGLATSHGDILYALFDREKMTMAEIASKIHKDKSTVTALVNKLCQIEYVKKEKEQTDTRVNYVFLTEKGKALKSIFIEISNKLMEDFYRGVSEEEKEAFLELLCKIEKNL